jgi:hypothetical protein
MRHSYYRRLSSTHLAVLDLVPFFDRGLLLTRINVPKPHRGLGIASLLLNECLTDADALRVTIWLEISPSDGLNYTQLHAWYVRHHFVDEGKIMVRHPILTVDCDRCGDTVLETECQADGDLIICDACARVKKCQPL